MTLWLLDTNVVSELRRPKPNQNVLDFINSHDVDTLYLSTVTIAEIRYGIEVETDAVRRRKLETWLEQDIRRMFAGRILLIGEDVMLRWRMLIGKGRSENRTFTQPDLLISATALHHGLTIASRDRKGFVATGTQVFDPWTWRR